MDASVVIPARNASATLPRTLAALARQESPPSFEVLVVDDGSGDDTRALAAAADQLPLRVLDTNGGEGPGAARNLGAAQAKGELLVFVDADCEPEPHWLERIVAAARDAELVQGKVLPPEGVHARPFDRVLAVVSEYGLYQTANLAIRRDLFESIGGFEQIVMPRRSKEMGEDAWLAWRARRTGARTKFAGDAVVRHAIFPRGPGGYLGEQWRVRFFPVLVRHMPELRDAFLHKRWFLSHRSARFDVAFMAGLAALTVASPIPLVLVVPYLVTLWKESGRWGWKRRPQALPVHLLADAVRALALWYGSVRYATPVL